jgi:hypothetical protein
MWCSEHTPNSQKFVPRDIYYISAGHILYKCTVKSTFRNVCLHFQMLVTRDICYISAWNRLYTCTIESNFQNVYLRAHAHERVYAVHVSAHIEALHGSRAGGWRREAH